MKNPYNDYADKELCDIIQDIYESRSNGKRVESFVPYARELKDNINGSSEIITLRETLEMAKQNFYDVVCNRFMEIVFSKKNED